MGSLDEPELTATGDSEKDTRDHCIDPKVRKEDDVWHVQHDMHTVADDEIHPLLFESTGQLTLYDPKALHKKGPSHEFFTSFDQR